MRSSSTFSASGPSRRRAAFWPAAMCRSPIWHSPPIFPRSIITVKLHGRNIRNSRSGTSGSSRVPPSAHCSPTACRANRRCRIMRSSISKAAEDKQHPRGAIRERARAEGFDPVGFSAARAPETAPENLASSPERGHHGDMAWMATTAARRGDPEKFWSEAKSVIALGVNYTPAEDPLLALERRERGAVSVYAQGADYHDV